MLLFRSVFCAHLWSTMHTTVVAGCSILHTNSPASCKASWYLACLRSLHFSAFFCQVRKGTFTKPITCTVLAKESTSFAKGSFCYFTVYHPRMLVKPLSGKSDYTHQEKLRETDLCHIGVRLCLKSSYFSLAGSKQIAVSASSMFFTPSSTLPMSLAVVWRKRWVEVDDDPTNEESNRWRIGYTTGWV